MSRPSSAVRSIELVPAACGDTAGLLGAHRGRSTSRLPDRPGRFSADAEIEVGMRPEHVRLGENGIAGVVRLVQPVGPATHVTLDWEGGALMASLPGFVRLAVGSPVQRRARSRAHLSSSTARRAGGLGATDIRNGKEIHEPASQSNSVAHRDVDVSTSIRRPTQSSSRSRGRSIVARGEGIRVFDSAGKDYIDAMAGLWCASLGFQQQASCCRRHAGNTPSSASITPSSSAPTSRQPRSPRSSSSSPAWTGGKAYFATSGSEANETMVKLAWVYHTVRGKPTKRKVIARDRAFHGSTIAAASMCGLEFMHREFGLPLPGFLHTLCPSPYRGMLEGEDEAAFVERLASELERMILREGPDIDRRLHRRADPCRRRHHRPAEDLFRPHSGGAEEIRHPLPRRRDRLRLRHAPATGSAGRRSAWSRT